MNWRALGEWIIDFVKALRSGHGKFYAWTFAGGMILASGPAWWTDTASSIAIAAIERVFDIHVSDSSKNITDFQSYIIIVFGFMIIVCSIIGFHFHGARQAVSVSLDVKNDEIAVSISKLATLDDLL
jgi:hypothetical protein